MAFLLKKVIKPWNASKSSNSNLTVPDQPMCPPSPDLSHLTPEEIAAIHEVIRRQEEFDKQEEDRVRKLKEELEGLQQQLAIRSVASTHNKKLVDLRLCRLCFKTKFADGVGRVCSDCQQRVCPQCGAFCKPRSSFKRNKSMRGRWRCKLCIARREMLCRTGKWYHGTPDPAEGVKKKLSLVCDQDGETDAGSSTCHANVDDSEACPSGNRTDSELIRRIVGKPASKNAPAGKKYTRRRSLPQDSMAKDDRGADLDDDDDDDDCKDSLDSLIVERRLSRRRRQEKKQRRKMRSVTAAGCTVPATTTLTSHTLAKSAGFPVTMTEGRSVPSPNSRMAGCESVLCAVCHASSCKYNSLGQDQRSTESLSERPRSMYAEDRTTSSDRAVTAKKNGERRDSITRSLWGHSNSLTSCVQKSPTLNDKKRDNSLGSSTSISSVFSSFRDSSMSDGFNGMSPVMSPPSLKIIRQDALSLNSSCVSITSASEPGRRSYAGSSDPVSTRSKDSFHSSQQHNKKGSAKSEDALSPKALGEKSEQKWRQAGFPDVYLVSLQCSQTKAEYPYGVKVVGGVQTEFKVSRAQVTWVSPEVRSKLSAGDEVLEWNGETLRGQSFDYVSSVTSFIYPQVIVIATPPSHRQESQMLCDTPIVITQDRPLNVSPELPGKSGKRRMLPRTPVEIKRGTRQIKGELKIRLHYQPHIATLAVSVLRVRNIVSPGHPENSSPSCFVVISIVPGKRDHFEIELLTSDSHPEWEQTFLFDGMTLTELVSKALQMTVWCYEEKCDLFVGEVLLDLVQAQLDNQAQWFNLEEHDENSAPLPHRRSSHSASLSASLTSGSFKDSSLFSPAVSPEVPSQRQHQHSPSSVGSNNVSPVPSAGTSHVGSREFHLNSVSQPDSFTTKVRKKMRTTVSKMASLTLIEKKDNAGSDESSHSDIIRRSSDKSDKGAPLSRSPNAMKRRQNSSQPNDRYRMEALSSLSVSSDHSMDLLAPPLPPSRTNSSSSFFLSDDEDTHGSISSAPPDRPPQDGDDVNSILGPGQIPPKPSAEKNVCGNIKLGFMVSKGQLEVDIICAAGLNKSGLSQPPDTYVKTYLVEGKKVIQRKKTLVVKTSFDPIYRKKVKYTACNVHGRIMKIDIWERMSSFEKKSCRGEVLVRLDGLDLSKHTIAWYKLFPINSTDYGSDEFLSSW